jgi:hypothetical protein
MGRRHWEFEDRAIRVPAPRAPSLQSAPEGLKLSRGMFGLAGSQRPIKQSPAVVLRKSLRERLFTEIPAEEWYHVILETVSHCTGVRARVNLKAVRDPVFIEDVVKLAGVDT